MENNYLKEYYEKYCNEDQRLLSKHGRIEFITTMKYIHKYIKSGKILELGAGTGRYSIALAKEGFEVTAVELIRHNIDVFKSKLNKEDKIHIFQGNATNLNMLKDNEYNMTLILGPMYHLYNDEDKVKVLEEAKRVTKNGGYILVAYCMNEATVIQYCFKDDGTNILNTLSNNMMTKDYHCLSKEQDLFEMVRIDDINRLNQLVKLNRIEIVSSDLFSNYLREKIDNMSDEVFNIYVDYHLTICNRYELIGVGNHSLDILRNEK